MLRFVLVASALVIGLTPNASSQELSPAKTTTQGSATVVQVSYMEASKHRLTPREALRTVAKPEERFFFESLELEIQVDEAGNVVSAKPQRGPERLYSAAMAQARSWKYSPFEKNGRPVAARFVDYLSILPLEDLPKVHVPFPQMRDGNALRIALRRTACFGSCPAYRVEISGDGAVVYVGTSSVLLKGTHRDHVSKDAVLQLVDAFRKADFFSLKDSYMLGATDLPTYIISITIDGQTKSVTDYAGEQVGMPHVVEELEQMIDKVTNTAKWIRGNGETVQSLMNEEWDFKSQEATTVLTEAAGSGTPEVVRDLVLAGVSLGKGVLLNAASRPDFAMVQMLLESGAGRGDPQQRDLALIAAAKRGDAQIMKLLLNYGANPNCQDSEGTTVVMAVASSGVPQVVAEVLKYQPDLNTRDKQGKTAVFYAASWRPVEEIQEGGHAEVVRLLAKGGANVNTPDKNGNTALHEATNQDAARALIENGADVNARNHDHQTPLMATWSAEVADILIHAGADLLAVDDKGHTALEAARSNGRLQQAKIEVLQSAMRGQAKK